MFYSSRSKVMLKFGMKKLIKILHFFSIITALIWDLMAPQNQQTNPINYTNSTMKNSIMNLYK